MWKPKKINSLTKSKTLRSLNRFTCRPKKINSLTKSKTLRSLISLMELKWKLTKRLPVSFSHLYRLKILSLPNPSYKFNHLLRQSFTHRMTKKIWTAQPKVVYRPKTLKSSTQLKMMTCLKLKRRAILDKQRSDWLIRVQELQNPAGESPCVKKKARALKLPL